MQNMPPDNPQKHFNDPSLFEALLTRLFGELNRCDTARECAWAITSQVIPYLKLEDCVVYLADAEQQTLVQAAAFGAKVKSHGMLESHVTLRFGRGIVGHCAAERKTQLVADTSQDSRYIIDISNRLSELSVPIIYDDQVLAVIDSEHSQRNYFTQDHVRLFETLAFVAAPFFARYIRLGKPNAR